MIAPTINIISKLIVTQSLNVKAVVILLRMIGVLVITIIYV